MERPLNGALIQLIGSAVAVATMVGVAAWLGVPRKGLVLDEAAARRILAVEYPDHAIDWLWLAADGRGALAGSGDLALVLGPLGDSWVGRDLPLAKALASPVVRGKVRLKFPDVGAPRIALAVSGIHPWPPQALQPSIAA